MRYPESCVIVIHYTYLWRSSIPPLGGRGQTHSYKFSECAVSTQRLYAIRVQQGLPGSRNRQVSNAAADTQQTGGDR